MLEVVSLVFSSLVLVLWIMWGYDVADIEVITHKTIALSFSA